MSTRVFLLINFCVRRRCEGQTGSQRPVVTLKSWLAAGSEDQVRGYYRCSDIMWSFAVIHDLRTYSATISDIVQDSLSYTFLAPANSTPQKFVCAARAACTTGDFFSIDSEFIYSQNTLVFCPQDPPFYQSSAKNEYHTIASAQRRSISRYCSSRTYPASLQQSVHL